MTIIKDYKRAKPQPIKRQSYLIKLEIIIPTDYYDEFKNEQMDSIIDIGQSYGAIEVMELSLLNQTFESAQATLMYRFSNQNKLTPQ